MTRNLSLAKTRSRQSNPRNAPGSAPTIMAVIGTPEVHPVARATELSMGAQAAAKSDCVRGRAVVRKLPAFAELVDVGARAIKKRCDLTHVERRATVVPRFSTRILKPHVPSMCRSCISLTPWASTSIDPNEIAESCWFVEGRGES